MTIKNNNINKHYIIAPVGSEKTSLAKRLSHKINIKIYELDKIVWNDDMENISRTEKDILKIFNKAIKQDKWIIEDIGRNIFVEGLIR